MSNLSISDLDFFLSAKRLDQSYFGIRLKEGETLYGSLHWPLSGDEERDLMGLGRDIVVSNTGFRCDAKFLNFFTVDVGIGVYQFKISRDIVDSVFVLPEFDSPTIDKPDHPRIKAYGLEGTYKIDLKRLLLDHTTSKIKALGLKYRKVVNATYVDSYPHPSIFPVWLPMKPKGKLPIYFDQDFWGDTVQWSMLNGKVSCLRGFEKNEYIPEFLTKGLISFFESPPTVTIEGSIWELCAITPDYIIGGELKKQEKWLLAALKPRWLLNALEVMERLEEPYKIFGNLLPVSVEIPGYGIKQSLLKILAASHLQETAETMKEEIVLTAGIKISNIAIRTNQVKRILFLSSDPQDAARLRVNQELRDIQEKLRLAKMRDLFTIESRPSARPGDISQALLDEKYHIVHFSGHGLASGALCFENLQGNAHFIQPDALAALFRLVSNVVHCVILNACYSEPHANAIAKYISYVIGTRKEICDKAAITFSVGFYKALGAGCSIRESFDFGIVEMQLYNLPEHLRPILIER